MCYEDELRENSNFIAFAEMIVAIISENPEFRYHHVQ